MDLDRALVASLLASKGAVIAARDRGVTVESLEGEGKRALEALFEYFAEYSEVPSLEVLEIKSGVKLPAVLEPPEFFVSEVLARSLHRDMKLKLEEVIANLEQAKPYEALDSLEATLRHMRATHTRKKDKADSLPKLFVDVVAFYDRMKSGERGILTPWESFNSETFGLWPEDLVLFVARLGVGKTWLAVILAHFAWVSGHKVLFGTTEMSKIRVAMRFAAVHFALSYKAMRTGQLDMFNEQRFRDGVTEIMDSQGLHVIGGDFDFKPASYEAAIEEVEPALSVFDGAYLLKAEGLSRTERAANAFDELKRIGKRTGVAQAVTMQFNRDVKATTANTSAAPEKIALTDVAGWNSDIIYALAQTEDMKRDRRMMFKPMKMREGVGKEFESNWDLDRMNFEELPSGDAGDAADVGIGEPPDPNDPFATGVHLSDASQLDVPF